MFVIASLQSGLCTHDLRKMQKNKVLEAKEIQEKIDRILMSKTQASTNQKIVMFGKHSTQHYFPSISYYFHIPKFFLNFFPHTGKNRNRRKSNLLP